MKASPGLRNTPTCVLFGAILCCACGPVESSGGPNVGPADPADPADPAVPVDPVVLPLPPAGDCGPAMVTQPEAAYGAVAASDDGKLYVVGDTNAGNGWQLGELDLMSRVLTPVIDIDSSWLEEGWIGLAGDEVTVYEFYPRGVLLSFNRVTGEVVDRPGVSPTYESQPHPWQGDSYSVLIGRTGNPCGNVCIVRGGGDSVAVLVDDAEEPYSIANVEAYLEGWAYFTTFLSSSSQEEVRTLRRLHLTSGQVELVYSLPVGAVNAGITELTVDDDGRIYWVRAEQQTLQSDWQVTIDRYKPVANEVEEGIIEGLDRTTGGLRFIDGMLVFRSNKSIHRFTPDDGELVALLGPTESSTRIHYTTRSGRLYYSMTLANAEPRTAELGCVELLGD